MSQPGPAGASSEAVQVVALDGDDTLWHSETHFADANEVFASVLEPYVGGGFDVVASQYETERHNLELFGYGVKGFTLSMIETAIEVTGGAISGPDVQRLIDLGKNLLAHPVELLPGVKEALAALTGRYRLVLVTKGDLFHQEQKVAASGLADQFEQVEIVSEKDEMTYRRVCARLGVDPSMLCMVGNSVRSDVLPVLAIGGRAVQVPYQVTWAHEDVAHNGGFPVLASIAELPAWLASLG
jgi:putative hydrolase of the HAD superfamily